MTSLCLSGGGSKILTMLGLLHELHTNNKLKDIKIYSGCSAGSFVCVLLALGVTPLQMLELFPTNVKIDDISLSTFITKQGLARVQKHTKKLRNFISDKMGNDDPTLQEFYEFTHTLVYIESVNLTKCSVVYFNSIEHPNIKLFDALHASCSVTGLFIPVSIKNCKFTDGGYYCNLPLEPLIHTKTIAIDFGKPEFAENVMFEELLKLFKLKEYLTRKKQIKSHSDLQLYTIKSDCSFLDFNLNDEEMLQHFEHGRSQY